MLCLVVNVGVLINVIVFLIIVENRLCSVERCSILIFLVVSLLCICIDNDIGSLLDNIFVSMLSLCIRFS